MKEDVITIKRGDVELFITYIYEPPEPETGFTGSVAIQRIQWIKSIHILGSEIIDVTPIFDNVVPFSKLVELSEEIKLQIEQPII